MPLTMVASPFHTRQRRARLAGRSSVGLVALALALVMAAVVSLVAYQVTSLAQDQPVAFDDYRAQTLELVASRQRLGRTLGPTDAIVADGWQRLATLAERIKQTPEGEYALIIHDLDVRAELRRSLHSHRLVRPWSTPGLLWDQLLPHVAPLKTLAKALGSDLDRLAASERWDDFVATVDDLQRLSDAVGMQASLVEWRIGLAIAREALDAVDRSLTAHPPPPATQRELGRMLQRWQRSLDGSIAYHIELERLCTQSLVLNLHGSRGYALPLATLFADGAPAGAFMAFDPVDVRNDPRPLTLVLYTRFQLATRVEIARLVDQWFSELAPSIASGATTFTPSAQLSQLLANPRNVLLTRLLSPIDRVVQESKSVEETLHRLTVRLGGERSSS